MNKQKKIMGSLFSGIGGFELAGTWLSWQVAFHCEIEAFPRQVLQYYWPNAQSYTDIKTTDFTKYANKIDVLTGGFPCQPFSVAGNRTGTEDNRYLWPEYLRAIRQIKPATVVGENVTGIFSMAEREVFARVEGKTITRYADVDKYEAVYIRQEKMLVASICEDLEKEGYKVQPFVIPAAGVGAPHRRNRVWFVAHATIYGRQRRRQAAEAENRHQARPQHAGQLEGGFERPCSNGATANSFYQRLQRDEQHRKHQNKNKTGKTSFHGAIAQFCRCGYWQNFPTQPPVCGRNDGLSAQLDGITFSKWRSESIKAYGNAIVPQVAYQIFKAINNL